MTDTDPGPRPCERCGEVHVRDGRPTCSGHRSNGLPCKKYPIRGGAVCEMHGGGAPHVRAAADQRMADAAMERVLSFAIANPDQRHLDKTPDEQLLEEV